MTAPTGAPGTRRFALDGYRAVAAIAVLVFHAYQFNRTGPGSAWPLEGTLWHDLLMHTDLAVDMFFVLSGLLLGLPFARSALGFAPPRALRLYFARRLARLLPLYLVVVVLVWSISTPDFPGDLRDLLLHLSFTHVYASDRIFWTVGPAWTLACEVHFIVLLGVLGAWAQSRVPRLSSLRLRYAVLAAGIAVLMAVSAGYRVWAAEIARFPITEWAVWFNPLAKLDVFALGLVLALVAAPGTTIGSAWARRGLVLSAVVVGVTTAVLAPATERAGLVLAHTGAGLACALLLASTTLAPQQPRWLVSRPMVVLGTLGYGLYLWQEPVQRALAEQGLLPDKQPGPTFLVAALAVLVVTVAVAWLSHHVIERSGMRLAAGLDAGGRRRDLYPEPSPPPAPLPAPLPPPLPVP